MYTQSITVGNLPRAFIAITEGRLAWVPVPILITILVVAVTYYLLHHTMFGRHLFALGTSHTVARISGLPVKKVVFRIFLISGFFAAVGGVIMTARVGAGMPALAREMLLDIVAAVIIGGTSITGGEGSIMGTLIGAVFIIVLNNSLRLLGVQWYVIKCLQGNSGPRRRLSGRREAPGGPRDGQERGRRHQERCTVKEILLALEGIRKSFAGVTVLEDVSLTLARGTVLGLVGENGAGKSTLMNILGGVHPRDGGRILLEGREYSPAGPTDALRDGVVFIHQELNLFTNLSVAENIYIDGYPRGRSGASPTGECTRTPARCWPCSARRSILAPWRGTSPWARGRSWRSAKR